LSGFSAFFKQAAFATISSLNHTSFIGWHTAKPLTQLNTMAQCGYYGFFIRHKCSCNLVILDVI